MNFPVTLQAYRPTKSGDIEVETKVVNNQFEADLFIKKHTGGKRHIKIVEENHLRDLETKPTIKKAADIPQKKAIRWDIIGIISIVIPVLLWILDKLFF